MNRIEKHNESRSLENIQNTFHGGNINISRVVYALRGVRKGSKRWRGQKWQFKRLWQECLELMKDGIPPIQRNSARSTQDLCIFGEPFCVISRF